MKGAVTRMPKLDPAGVIANQLQVARRPGSTEYPFADVSPEHLLWHARNCISMLEKYGYVIVPASIWYRPEDDKPSDVA